MAVVEEDYVGREQTWIKHLILRRYLQAWGMKLAMTAVPGRDRIWYVDCFAGPWRANNEAKEDTSAAIALRALNEVGREAAKSGRNVGVGAVFIEMNSGRASDLESFVDEAGGDVTTHVFSGAFGDCVEKIRRTLGSDAAFVFVDPTGWKGADMAHVARLASSGRRDVLINFMFDYLNRFKGEGQRGPDQREWLIEQLAAFFGISDTSVLASMSEEELVQEYCRNLKSACNLRFALSLAVPKPTSDRTYFHLIVGGSHKKVVELFRDVEFQVIGGAAGAVMERARLRAEQERTGQHSLFENPDARIRSFDRRRDEDLGRLPSEILLVLREGDRLFSELWPELLERLHVRLTDTKDAATRLYKSGKIEAGGWNRQRKVKDQNRLRIKGP